MDEAGDIYWSPNGNPRRKVYCDAEKGVPIQDLWLNYRDSINQQMKTTGYPTEKNIDMLRMMKKTIMGNVLHFLTICLGEPPKLFDVRLRDKDDKMVLAGRFTPQTFFPEVTGMNVDDYVSIVSAPTADKPFDRTYTVQRLGNVIEAGGVRYLNLRPEQLKQLAVKQLEDGLPVCCLLYTSPSPRDS